MHSKSFSNVSSVINTGAGVSVSATAAKEHASLPTRVAAVADNTRPLRVSQRDSKCDGGASVIKDSNFRLNVREFRFLLRSHPNARWVDWLLENLEQGFGIGCKDNTLQYT